MFSPQSIIRQYCLPNNHFILLPLGFWPDMTVGQRIDRRMLQYDFENSPGYWMVITTRAMRRGMEAELANEGITLRQWEVLAWLTIENGMSQSALADRLGIEAPTLAGILDRMERDGWVERQACTHDRRKKRLRATAKADAVWQSMAECAYRMRDKATAGISGEELQQLKSLCERIRLNLGDASYQVPDSSDCLPVPDSSDCLPVAASQSESDPLNSIED